MDTGVRHQNCVPQHAALQLTPARVETSPRPPFSRGGTTELADDSIMRNRILVFAPLDAFPLALGECVSGGQGP